MKEIRVVLHRKPEEIHMVTPLEKVGIVTLPAVLEPFVARDKFVVSRSDDAPVKIRFISRMFTSIFLSGSNTSGESQTETTLSFSTLVKASGDHSIFAELGEKTETTLECIYRLMRLQAHGDDGVLLNNGFDNVFYVQDLRGVRLAVLLDWHPDGWGVAVSETSHISLWRAGTQMFSHS